MEDWKKADLMQTIVYLVVGIVVFFTFVAVYKLAVAGSWWASIVPVIGAGYGVYAFVKKYYRNR